MDGKSSDSENDPISYMFRLKGPYRDIWLLWTKWTLDNTWKWDTLSRRGKIPDQCMGQRPGHEGTEFKPVRRLLDYTITQPQGFRRHHAGNECRAKTSRRQKRAHPLRYNRFLNRLHLLS